MPEPSQNFVWYCRTFSLETQLSGDHSLNLGVIGDLDVVFVDGEEIGGFGGAGGSTPVGIHHYRSYRLWPNLLTAGTHTLEIRVKQTDAVSGAINQQDELAILPARTSELFAWRHDFLRTELLFALGIAILVTGLYYGMLWLIEKREKRFFHFACLCISLSAVTAAFSYRFTVLLGNAALEWKLGAIGGFWATHFLMSFIRESERKPYGNWDRVSLYIAAFATIADLFARDIQEAGMVSFLWVPWFFISVGYTGVTVVRAWQRQRTTVTTMIMIGFWIFAITSNYDFIVGFGAPEAYVLSPYAYILFAFSLNALLAQEHGNALVDRRKKVVLEAQVAQLRTLADIDPLTQLNNRRTFFEHLEYHFDLARTKNVQFALLVLDIDHFKRFNDAHGHPEGDRLLRTFSEVLSKSVRPTDVVGRLGGEEFGVLLAEVHEGLAMMLAERIRYAIETCPLMRNHLDGAHVTVSIGIAEPKKDTADITSLYEKADAALYVAKRVRNSTMKFSLIPTAQDLARISSSPKHQGSA